eukprot:scaffold1037_cov157-Amphora_coffeaeformis.AAC.9
MAAANYQGPGWSSESRVVDMIKIAAATSAHIRSDWTEVSYRREQTHQDNGTSPLISDLMTT